MGAEERKLIPGLVLVELDYWCSKLGLQASWSLFLEDVEEGAAELVWPTEADLGRARELEEQYASLGLGVVDASIVALAERLDEPRLATLDRRHFGAVRPKHVAGFHLLPEEW